MVRATGSAVACGICGAPHGGPVQGSKGSRQGDASKRWAGDSASAWQPPRGIKTSSAGDVGSIKNNPGKNPISKGNDGGAQFVAGTASANFGSGFNYSSWQCAAGAGGGGYRHFQDGHGDDGVCFFPAASGHAGQRGLAGLSD